MPEANRASLSVEDENTGINERLESRLTCRCTQRSPVHRYRLVCYARRELGIRT